jgi:hypothetical protein
MTGAIPVCPLCLFTAWTGTTLFSSYALTFGAGAFFKIFAHPVFKM